MLVRKQIADIKENYIIMNILYLTSNLSMGGTELFAFELATTMRSLGENVYWGAIKDGVLKKQIDESGVCLFDCGLGRKPIPNPIAAIRKVRKAVKKYHIDIIHAIDAYSAIVSCYAFKFSRNRPKIVWSNVGIGISSYITMHDKCERYLDGITTETQYIRFRLMEAGFDPFKIKVFHRCRPLREPSTDPNTIRQQLNIRHDDYVIITVGRLVLFKGNHILISALPSLLKSHPNVKLLIIGDGPERNNLVEQARQLKVSDNVIFKGFVNDVENYYNASDLVAFPTYIEALGHICFEAMYYKKPIVASYTGGVIENIQDHKTGLLVPAADIEAWSNSILEVIENEALSEELVRNGTDFMRKVEMERPLIDANINKFYHDLCK